MRQPKIDRQQIEEYDEIIAKIKREFLDKGHPSVRDSTDERATNGSDSTGEHE